MDCHQTDAAEQATRRPRVNDRLVLKVAADHAATDDPAAHSRSRFGR